MILTFIENGVLFTIIALTVHQLLFGQWYTLFFYVLALSVAAIPFVLRRVCDITVPKLIRTGFVLFIFMTIVLGELQQFYDTYEWWDLLLHAFAGFGIALTMHIVLALVAYERHRGSAPILLALFALCASVSISAGWEIYEFFVDMFFANNMQPSNSDTMWDLVAGTVGALPAAYIGWKWHRRQLSDGIFSKMLDDGVDDNRQLQ